MRYPLEQFVTAILTERYDLVQLAPPLWSPDAHDSFVRRLLARAGRPPWSDPRHIALALGHRLVPRAPRGMCGEGCSPDVIAYDWGAGREVRGMLVGHGCIHQNVRRQPEESNESDAWWMTARLCVPPRDVHSLRDSEVLTKAHAPAYFVRLALASFRGCFPEDHEQSSRIYPRGLTL